MKTLTAAALAILTLGPAVRAQSAAEAAAVLGFAGALPAAPDAPPSRPAAPSFSFFSAPRVDDIPQVGPHYPLLTYSKNENPRNVMKIYTKLDADCAFLPDPAQDGRPTFDFYWLMDGRSYKPVNPMIESGIRERLAFEPGSAMIASFAVRLNDLSLLKQDLASPLLTVRAARDGASCGVAAYITLGPSDGGATIRLTGIYSEAHASLRLPYFQTLDAVTLTGADAATGRPVSRRYPAK